MFRTARRIATVAAVAAVALPVASASAATSTLTFSATSTSTAAMDVFGDSTEPILLLPAAQRIREAAAR